MDFYGYRHENLKSWGHFDCPTVPPRGQTHRTVKFRTPPPLYSIIPTMIVLSPTLRGPYVTV
jgi:hypothetical protein